MASWFADIGTGLLFVMSIPVLTAALGGVVLGVFVGAVPGLTVAVAIALAIPLTFTLEPVTAMALLLGVFKGGIYGGSISAILINTPGTAAAAATVFDGYPMALKGQAGKALKVALLASVFADAVAIAILIAVAEPIARIALKFGPVEIASLLIFSLSIIAVVSGESLLKGIMAASIGLALATVGQDPITGSIRFDFGPIELYSGFALVPMLIGLFAISEVFVQWERPVTDASIATIPRTGNPDDDRVTRSDLRLIMPTFMRASMIGVAIGALPGIGSTVSAFLSYGAAKQRSKTPELFGKGSVEGVAAAEAGNNAVVGASLIPLLTFGIPGDLIAAILLGAFMIHGVPVGPLLFTDHREFIFGVFAILILSIGMLYITGLFAIWVFRRITDIPRSIVFSVVMILCIVGGYTVNNSMFDVFIMVGFGVVGYVFRKFEIPLPPLLIAFVLGPRAEDAMRQALILSRGSWDVFVTRPISLVFLVLTVLAVVLLTRFKLRER
jgi:putative tricarboxylic transport membrane protein